VGSQDNGKQRYANKETHIVVQPSAFLCNGEWIGPHAKIDGRVDFQDGVGYEWGVKITGNRGMQTKKLTL